MCNFKNFPVVLPSTPVNKGKGGVMRKGNPRGGEKRRVQDRKAARKEARDGDE
jgi:hypothetical protein